MQKRKRNCGANECFSLNTKIVFTFVEFVQIIKNAIKSQRIVSNLIVFREDAGSFNADESFYMPTVYYQNSNEWNRISSGVTYNAIDLKHILAKRTSKTYLVNVSNPLRAIAQH